jgi:preprotein translocase subunit YajC
MTAALALVAPLLGAAAKKSSSGSPTLLIFAAIAAAFYFLIYRPQQRKSKAARAQTNAFDVGDEVLTAGGIVGHVIDIDGDRVTLETSVGASFVVLKQYVLRRLEEPVAEDEDEDSEYEEDEYEDHDEAGEHEHGTELPEGSSGHDPDQPDEADGGGHVDEATAADEGPNRGGTSKKGKKNDSDDQSGLDGPSII